MRNYPNTETIPPDALQEINIKAIRSALKQWNNLRYLSKHPLASLCIVTQRMHQKHREPDTYELGLSLQQILRDAIDELEPKVEESNEDYPKLARSYIVIEEYLIKNKSRGAVSSLIGLTESRVSDESAKALEKLASILYQWEKVCRGESDTQFTVMEEEVARVPNAVQFGDILVSKRQQMNVEIPAALAAQLTKQNTWWRQLSLLQRVVFSSVAGILLALIVSTLVYQLGNMKQNPAASSDKWCDSFDTTSLNREKWGLMEDKEGLVSIENGALNFQTDKALDRSIAGAEIILLPVGQPIKEGS